MHLEGHGVAVVVAVRFPDRLDPQARQGFERHDPDLAGIMRDGARCAGGPRRVAEKFRHAEVHRDAVDPDVPDA